MSNLFKHGGWTVDQLVSGVKSGQLRLPEIQRPFVWSNVKVRDLVDSIYRGYPVGELMLWSVAGIEDRAIGAGVAAEKAQDANYRIVDGQQRLTSLYAVMTGDNVLDDDYRHRKIRIAFNPLVERFEVLSPAIEASPEWVPDIVGVFESQLKSYLAFIERYEANHELTDDARTNLERAFERLHDIKKFPFNVVTLGSDVDQERVAEIFVRINSEGVKLTQADFILTRLSVFWDEGREELEEFSRNSHSTPETVSERTGTRTTWTPKNNYIAPDPGQILRVVVAVGQNRGRLANAYSALRGLDPRTRELLPESRERELGSLKAAQPDVLSPTNWDDFLRVLGRAGFRSKKMLASQTTLLYSYALWLIGLTRYGVARTELRELMARWFFMAQTTRRYTNAPESAIEEDLNRLADLQERNASAFVGALSRVIETELTNDYWDIRLPDDLDTSSRQSPAYQAYVAALNILDADLFALNGKVRDWMDPSAGTVTGVEAHHLFPRDLLRGQGIAEIRRVNQVANFAPTDFATNKLIAARHPRDYWPDLVAGRELRGAVLDNQRFWHALPEGWERLTYDAFLPKRRQLMAVVVHEGYRKLCDPAYTPQFEVHGGALVAEETLQDLRLTDLMEAALIRPGDILAASDPESGSLAEVTEDALISLGDELYDTPARAAHADGDEQSDGWEYWVLADGASPRTLRDLAEEYVRTRAVGA